MVADDESTPQSSPRRGNRDRRDPRGPRPSDVGLVKILTSAQVDAGVTHEAAGVILFKHIFRIAPQALPLFSFGRVEGAAVNDLLLANGALLAPCRRWIGKCKCARP